MSGAGSFALRGARLFDGTGFCEGMALIVEGGEIAALVPEAGLGAMAAEDLGGGILAPGFVDLQVNGGAGRMLGADPGVAEIAAICAAHAGLGATGILPTLITDTPGITRAVVEAGIAAAGRVPGFLGLHLEGPHLDPRRHGAHDPALIRPMEEADLALLTEAARRLPALLVTLAPESATETQIAALAGAGAVVSLGHSDTGAAAARAAFAAGARAVTHLFNAMSPLGHREPGLVGAALSTPGIGVGLIADGIHVAPEVIGIALRAGGTERVFLVSDAMAVAGTGLDEFTLRGRKILRREGRLTLADGTLAGADIDIPGALRVLRGVGVAPERALAMATANPAGLIGARSRGRLAPGGAADLVHLDADFRARRVWQGGAELPREGAASP
ncbi:N-acetylglucosamine-6-phosphate deacetylase [Amaricoccus solimangrovi]|uniref:N-acetylglucosamine-6-phosphate deacetylase n=1 Tax=Amaricoccus solimangrovi TaxID=2589815 RepID=A0A501WW82_9RHOB|nr:N-acetylglucosamine-6-phosphate deacetylase [Amaricoccus solimangrovi]TPE52992.1 N-acetylglucosamine-6-phosphate deacetylase [Amaricoccus solimangrovi]